MGYNRQFDLSLDDIELIENALRYKQKSLSIDDAPELWLSEKEERLKQTQELLGRLHNQKQFYRPKKGSYVSG